MSRPPVVVMGVSGCGKSTIGALLAAELGTGFIDADGLHPVANKEKMAAGIPLDDADREPWLRLVSAALADTGDGGARVVACSALKRRYRDLLRSAAPDAFFAHLAGSPELIADRLGRRSHEFMPPALLASQFSSLEQLEPDEAGVTMDLGLSPVELVERLVAALDEQRAHAD